MFLNEDEVVREASVVVYDGVHDVALVRHQLQDGGHRVWPRVVLHREDLGKNSVAGFPTVNLKWNVFLR